MPKFSHFRSPLRFIAIYSLTAIVLSTSAVAASGSTLPTVGTGSGEISVRLGTVSGSPGTWNTQFVVGGGSPYTFPGGTSQGTYSLISVGYSVDSNPHSLAVYQGSRPSSIGGSGIAGPGTVFTATQGVASVADATFTPTSGSSGIVACWTLNFYATAGTATPITVCSNNSDGAAGSSAKAESPAPARYSGPEFSSLSLKPVLQGASTTLTGKNLDEISSIEIGGVAASISPVSETEIQLTPASGLAPGNYDLVIYSAAGKLTHINAVRVQPPLRAFSITSVSEGRISEEQYYEHSIVASMQQPELNKARCVVNAASLAQAKAQAARLCSLVAGANPNIETTIVEAKSTVKGTKVFARVTYGWSE